MFILRQTSNVSFICWASFQDTRPWFFSLPWNEKDIRVLISKKLQEMSSQPWQDMTKESSKVVMQICIRNIAGGKTDSGCCFFGSWSLLYDRYTLDQIKTKIDSKEITWERLGAGRSARGSLGELPQPGWPIDHTSPDCVMFFGQSFKFQAIIN